MRPAASRGLTSPDPATAPHGPPGQPPASIPGKRPRTRRTTVSGRKTTPAISFKLTFLTIGPKAITPGIHAVDRGLGIR